MIIVRYAEIGLKGKNRSFFEIKLASNIKKRIKGKITRPRGRILVDSDKYDKLKYVFGISSYSPAIEVKPTIKAMREQAKKMVYGNTFKIKAQRLDKNFPIKSPEINSKVGEAIDKKVDIKNPDCTIGIEIIQGKAYMFTETIRGLGGLPVGTAGRVLCMLSGGIDSPVAALMMMKRGCSVDFIHFHNYPYVKKKSIDKVKELHEILSKYQGKSKLIMVAFTKIQKEIVTKCPAKLRIILYRRKMIKIAEKYSDILVTGESIAQVSSQTLKNMKAVDSVTKKMVLRPLVGMDKIEIMDSAKKYGTYKKSIEPHEDCCTFFVPKKPETHAKIKEVLEAEKNIEDIKCDVSIQ